MFISYTKWITLSQRYDRSSETLFQDSVRNISAFGCLGNRELDRGGIVAERIVVHESELVEVAVEIRWITFLVARKDVSLILVESVRKSLSDTGAILLGYGSQDNILKSEHDVVLYERRSHRLESQVVIGSPGRKKIIFFYFYQ